MTIQEDIKKLLAYAEDGRRSLTTGVAGRVASFAEKALNLEKQAQDALGEAGISGVDMAAGAQRLVEMLAEPKHEDHGGQTQVGWIGHEDGHFYPISSSMSPETWEEPGGYSPVYVDDDPTDDTEEAVSQFISDLTGLINRYSLDTAAGTPDFILASMLKGMLDLYVLTADSSRAWHDIPTTQENEVG